MLVSFKLDKALSPFLIYIVIFFGIIKLITCFPVHKGYGLRIAGIGSSPGKRSSILPFYLFYLPSIQMTKFIIYSLVKKVSLIVNRYTPNSASWTIPMTGALFLGAIICLGT
jgi:hypothetical protein